MLVGLSGPYTFGDRRLLEEIADQERALGFAEGTVSNQRVYLAVGSYESGPAASDGGPLDLVEAAEALEAVLTASGRQVRLEQRPAGHSWGAWRDALVRGLIFLYG